MLDPNQTDGARGRRPASMDYAIAWGYDLVGPTVTTNTTTGRRRPRSRLTRLPRALPAAPSKGRTFQYLAHPTRRRQVYYGGTTRIQIGLPRRCTVVNPQHLINLGIDWQGNWAVTTRAGGHGDDNKEAPR